LAGVFSYRVARSLSEKFDQIQSSD